MSGVPLLAAASKSGLGAAAPLLLGLGLLAGLVAMAAAMLRAEARGGEARSRDDVGGRLRALDELASHGGLNPEEYAKRQAALLNEI
jgi:gas vesicle protein